MISVYSVEHWIGASPGTLSAYTLCRTISEAKNLLDRLAPDSDGWIRSKRNPLAKYNVRNNSPIQLMRIESHRV